MMRNANPIIVLMGLRGSGKSTLGQLLATRKQTHFVDLDDATVALMGCADVAQAWQRFGEARFRLAETQVLGNVLTASPAPAQQPRLGVLALGGGTPTAPGAEAILREAIRTNAIELVYLRASPAVLSARLSETDVSTRPSLTGAPMLEEIAAVYRARDELYRSLASRVLEIDRLSVDQILDAIESELDRL